jgi:hypothetical protein
MRFQRVVYGNRKEIEIVSIDEVQQILKAADLSFLRTSALSKTDIKEGILSFLKRYQEGAWIALSILALARGSYEWVKSWQSKSAKFQYENAEWPLLAFRPHILGSDNSTIHHLTIEQAAFDIIKTVLAITPVLTPRVPGGSEIETLKRSARRSFGKWITQV